MMVRRIGLACLAVIGIVGLAACTALRGSPAPDTRIVAVGDSILAWNRTSGRDIPQVVSQRTGLAMFNGAISGAEFLGPRGIPSQYPAGDWDWVIVDGGGNDIGNVCGDPAGERRVLDMLIAPDLGGAYANFLRRVTVGDTRVIVMGYAPISIEGGPFAACSATLNELRTRQGRLAQAMEDVTFVDVRQVVRPNDLSAYARDLVHPTPSGGALMAGLIAAAMAQTP